MPLLYAAKVVFDTTCHDGIIHEIIEAKFPDHLIKLIKWWYNPQSILLRCLFHQDGQHSSNSSGSFFFFSDSIEIKNKYRLFIT